MHMCVCIGKGRRTAIRCYMVSSAGVVPCSDVWNTADSLLREDIFCAARSPGVSDNLEDIPGVAPSFCRSRSVQTH